MANSPFTLLGTGKFTNLARAGGANAGGLLGLTTHGQSRPGGSVAGRKAGIARARAAGPIALGAPVQVADDQGRVREVEGEGGTLVQCLGFAETPAGAQGDVIEVFISIHERIIPPEEP